jgi:DnaJ-class molecular chaperone
MIEHNKQQDENMMDCPVCTGHREIRGAVSKIAWFNCGYCNGTGKVTKKRFYAWQDPSSESPAVNAVNTSESLTDRIQTEAENS